MKTNSSEIALDLNQLRGFSVALILALCQLCLSQIRQESEAKARARQFLDSIHRKYSLESATVRVQEFPPRSYRFYEVESEDFAINVRMRSDDSSIQSFVDSEVSGAIISAKGNSETIVKSDSEAWKIGEQGLALAQAWSTDLKRGRIARVGHAFELEWVKVHPKYAGRIDVATARVSALTGQIALLRSPARIQFVEPNSILKESEALEKMSNLVSKWNASEQNSQMSSLQQLGSTLDPHIVDTMKLVIREPSESDFGGAFAKRSLNNDEARLCWVANQNGVEIWIDAENGEPMSLVQAKTAEPRPRSRKIIIPPSNRRPTKVETERWDQIKVFSGAGVAIALIVGGVFFVRKKLMR